MNTECIYCGEKPEDCSCGAAETHQAGQEYVIQAARQVNALKARVEELRQIVDDRSSELTVQELEMKRLCDEMSSLRSRLAEAQTLASDALQKNAEQERLITSLRERLESGKHIDPRQAVVVNDWVSIQVCSDNEGGFEQVVSGPVLGIGQTAGTIKTVKVCGDQDDAG